MTARRLAEIIGISAMQITNYEKGDRRMGAARLYAIAKALDVPISYFFSDLEAKATPATTDLEPSQSNWR